MTNWEMVKIRCTHENKDNAVINVNEECSIAWDMHVLSEREVKYSLIGMY